jgi:hypothetical protein
VAKASKKTCDELHHVCFITGDPGPCRSKELVSSWRNMVGDAHTKKRKRGWELLVGLDVGTSDYPLIEGVESGTPPVARYSARCFGAASSSAPTTRPP